MRRGKRSDCIRLLHPQSAKLLQVSAIPSGVSITKRKMQRDPSVERGRGATAASPRMFSNFLPIKLVLPIWGQ